MGEACDTRQTQGLPTFYPIPGCWLLVSPVTTTSEALGLLSASIKKEGGGERGGRG